MPLIHELRAAPLLPAILHKLLWFFLPWAVESVADPWSGISQKTGLHLPLRRTPTETDV
jgi:hypothetical protein